MGFFDKPTDDEELNKNFQDAQESLNLLLNSTGGIAKHYSKELSKSGADLLDVFEGAKKDFLEQRLKDDDGFCGKPNWREFHGHGFPWGRGRRHGENQYGLWAYPVPSVKAYDKCQAKEGVSVWDKEGVWRCLFPTYAMPQDGSKGVTKEDYLSNRDGARDNYFQDFTGYLGWKSTMRQLQREERQKAVDKRREVIRESFNSKREDAKRNNAPFVSESASLASPASDNVVGTSLMNSTRTNEDGSVENYTKVLKWYQDGSSKVEETRKVIPTDGSAPKVERNVDHRPAGQVVSLGKVGEKPSGWFWDN